MDQTSKPSTLAQKGRKNCKTRARNETESSKNKRSRISRGLLYSFLCSSENERKTNPLLGAKTIDLYRKRGDRDGDEVMAKRTVGS